MQKRRWKGSELNKLAYKTKLVLNSCKTQQQLEVAAKYTYLSTSILAKHNHETAALYLLHLQNMIQDKLIAFGQAK